MRRILRAAGLVALMLAYAIEAGVISLVIRQPVARERVRVRRLQVWLSRIARLLGVRIRQRGGISAGPVLLVSNHVSWLDVIVLGAIAPLRFVAKAEVRGWPLIGALVAAAGTLFVRRGDRYATGHVIDAMTWSLASGTAVAVFPEGTSSDGTLVRRFRSRLFGAACRTGTPVQVAALRYLDAAGELAPFIGDDTFLRHLWTVLGQKEVVVEVRVGLPTASIGRTPRALAREAHTEAVSYLGNNRVIRSSSVPAIIRGS